MSFWHSNSRVQETILQKTQIFVYLHLKLLFNGRSLSVHKIINQQASHVRTPHGYKTFNRSGIGVLLKSAQPPSVT